ncbi:conserved oligomeric Golgi complex subunit 1 isoform X1 [Hydra vulgaris]|uniref:conserved oligomeric Golgi complex subunit 1 isoform X1 n=1 Tax=Hydra vulgaris TaxID=6087 RepID=UPI000640D8E9|nr:conserved oligomeric Golgi complex subunit 1 [Hydra vulgaris]
MVSLPDVRLLFQTHSIEEINVIEKKIRGEIEKKKDDLRIMVGERYRDLINAADTIKDMESESSQVFGGIKNIQNLCLSFHTSLMSSCSSKITQSPRDVAFYSLATQMDLLVNTPEKIWNALDNHEYLNATQLYMFSHHIVNKSLNILVNDPKPSNSQDVYASFPVLHHQWAAISHFKTSILKGAEYSLKDKTLPDKKLCESLCSLALLDNCSPRQVFATLLLARKAAIQDVFRSNIYATSVKKQIVEIAYILKLTIEQMTLFYSEEEVNEKSLFYAILSQITEERSDNKTVLKLFGDEITSTVAPYLPESVSGFVPKLRTAPLPISKQYIQQHLTEWFQNCLEEIQNGIKILFPYVNNIKGLSAIQDSVFNLFLPGNSVSEDFENPWLKKCDLCFGKPISIWDEIFRPGFVSQAEIIISKHLEISFYSLEKQLESSLKAMEDSLNETSEVFWDHDLVSFLWHDFPQDFSNLIDDKLKGLDKNFLSMKIKSYTPSLKNICSNFDDSLLNILQDICFLIEGSSQNTAKQEVVCSFSPFDKYANSKHLLKVMQERLLNHVECLCTYVKNELNVFANKLVDESLKSTTLIIDKIVYLGRFCLALPDLCQNLENIVEFDAERKKSKTASSHSAAFKLVETKFKDQAMICFEIWIKWIHRLCSILIKETLDSEENHSLLSTTNWEEIVIEEEGESGAILKSNVKVPAQLSFYLSSLLFRIAEEFHRIGGNLLDSVSLQKLRLGIAASIISSHELFLSRLTDSVFQYRMLQILFDIKFINKLFINEYKIQENPELTQLRTSANKLVKSLEQHVDPFDLDVFTPHIELNIQKYLQKSMLVYGSISSFEKHISQVSTSQEQHNVVKMVENPPRFMLLPMSARIKEEDIDSNLGSFEALGSPILSHQTSVIN